MNLDWQAFTPWSALAGGLLIGLAATLFVLLNGRIAGISSIVGGLLRPVRGASPSGTPAGAVVGASQRATEYP